MSARARRGSRFCLSLLPAILVVCGACTTSSAPSAPPRIQLNSQTNTVDVTGLPAATVAALSNAAWTDVDWQALLRVSVKPAESGESSTHCASGSDGHVLRCRWDHSLHADVSVRRGRQYDVALDAARLPAVQGNAPWRTRSSPPSSETRGRALAVDRRLAPLSERRRRTGQPVADVPALFCADGLAERVRLRHAPRRARPGGRRRIPAARRRLLERGPHALHRVLRSRPRQARHPAEPADGEGARSGEALHAARQARVAGRPRASAQGRVQAPVSRQPCD